jgi:2-iminobutanoate/2-iminopropanoate deaminase
VLRYFNPSGLPKSPYYSHSARVENGALVLVSGQMALDENGVLVGPGDMAAQAERVFANIRLALEAAGAGVDDIVAIDTYYTSRADLAAYREARLEFFRGRQTQPPISVAVQVAGLVMEGAVVEVSVVAITAERPSDSERIRSEEPHRSEPIQS